MATTLSSFSGQFPQLSQFTTGTEDIISLHSFESNGNATVGVNYSILQTPTHNTYGKFNKCVTMDGGGSGCDAYTASSDTNWRWGAGKTYIIWIKPSGSPATNMDVHDDRWNGVGGSGESGSGMRFVISSGDPTYFSVTIEGAVVLSLTTNVNWVDITDGAWHCITYVAVSASEHYLYCDGILHDSSATNVGTVSPAGANFGADTYSGAINGYKGEFDECAVFSKAFTAKEAYAHGGALTV